MEPTDLVTNPLFNEFPINLYHESTPVPTTTAKWSQKDSGEIFGLILLVILSVVIISIVFRGGEGGDDNV